MRRLTIAAAWCGAFLAGAMALPAAAEQWQSWLPGEALAVLAVTRTNNPQIVGAAALHQAGTEQALAFDSFYDPRLAVSAGVAHGSVAAPESAMISPIGGDAASVQGGLLVPLRAGAYIGVGASQRYLFEADGFENLGQTVAGVRFEAPLLRNRGFRSQRMDQSALDAAAGAAGEQALAVQRGVLREMLARYATWLYAAADVREAGQALKRVESLHRETSERVALQTMAEYQVFSARMEVSFRQEDLRKAQSVQAQALHSLENIMGVADVTNMLTGGAAILRPWATLCSTSEVDRIVGATAETRPERRAAELSVAAAGYRQAAVREDLRSDLSLVAGVGYRGEDESGGLGSDNLLSDDRAGAEIALVWSRPWTFGATEARARAEAALLSAELATLRQVDLAIADETARARVALQAARERLGMVDEAVGAARRALEAEELRLNLGEGRSRNVLDAQKDLTDAERRANVAALDMILAFNNLMHAAGVPFSTREAPDVPLIQAP